ncbi:MAG: hypothetical protein EHM72_03140, partial [Calditrichaeota bacterium]
MTSSDNNFIQRIKGRGKIPRHIGIIMDGNGRWAQQRGLPRTEGHKAGIMSVRAVVEAAGEIDVAALTLY